MKSNLEKISSLERKLNIEVPNTVVQTAFERIYKNIQKEADIKGFRKGKAPLATIKSVYGDRVKQDVLNDLIQKAYIEALREHHLEPISYPNFEFDDLHEDKIFTFSAAFEVRPEVALKKYEGLAVEKEKFAFDEKKINDVLENIRASKAQLVPLLIERPAQLGDVAVVDFEGFVDGAPLQGGQGTDHHLELGSKSFIEGFEEGIVGMGIGATTTLHLKFPDPYHSAEIAGKPVDFKVTLKAIKKKDLPELTDEFVKTLGGPQTVEELKKTIREDLEQTEQKRIETDLKNRLLKVLVTSNPVEVPPSMLKEQKQALIEDFRKRMSEQGMNESEFEDYTKKWDSDFEKSAREMIQSSFLVDAIAKAHNLTCTDEDLNARYQEYARTTGIDEARIREFYGRPEQTSRLTFVITEEKVIAHLLKTAKVNEVSAEKLKEAQN